MNADEPAFPNLIKDEFHLRHEGGLTKREYFAAMALQGLISNPSLFDSMTIPSIKWVSERSTELADIVLSELAKTGRKEGQ